MVPEIGQVSTRRPVTRTNISGLAPTRYSLSPRFMMKPKGAGLIFFNRLKMAEGLSLQGS